MLSEDYVKRFIQATIDTSTPPLLTDAPDTVHKWRNQLQQLRDISEHEQINEDVEFFDFLLAVMNQQRPVPPDNSPYTPFLEEIYPRMVNQLTEYGRTLINAQRQFYQQLAEKAIAVRTFAPDARDTFAEFLEQLIAKLLDQKAVSNDEAAYLRGLLQVVNGERLSLDPEHPQIDIFNNIFDQIDEYHNKA